MAMQHGLQLERRWTKGRALALIPKGWQPQLPGATRVKNQWPGPLQPDHLAWSGVNDVGASGTKRTAKLVEANARIPDADPRTNNSSDGSGKPQQYG
jgi:hypothetical protein